MLVLRCLSSFVQLNSESESSLLDRSHSGTSASTASMSQYATQQSGSNGYTSNIQGDGSVNEAEDDHEEPSHVHNQDRTSRKRKMNPGGDDGIEAHRGTM